MTSSTAKHRGQGNRDGIWLRPIFPILKIIGHSHHDYPHPRNPLRGVTPETIVTKLVEPHGWAELGRRLPGRRFLNEPSVEPRLLFLANAPAHMWSRGRHRLAFYGPRA